ncbi:MAG: hypothetical protein KDC98_21565, partial [Planctomycetes bacterium]|nr:hypothetical protein [Planctomycetota bacterium]
LRVPDGRLQLEVECEGAGDDGNEVQDATVLIGDEDFTAKGALALRGLPLGRLRFRVGAPGHRTAIVDALVGAESHRISVKLPRR